MQPDRFDSITRFFAERRLTRRKALTEAGAGITAAGLAATGIAATGSAGAAQESATPEPSAGADGELPTLLFVQSFQSGSIAPKDGAEGRYTATFEKGLGETIYFSDRPDRIVGTWPTQEFLDRIGFTEDNAPNAAILTNNGDGDSTLAVVELFSPVYDADTATATYEVAVLSHWQDNTDMRFATTPVDVSDLGERFGTSHLFIDGWLDCPDQDMWCTETATDEPIGTIPNSDHDGFCADRSAWGVCVPCEGDKSYWLDQCAERFPRCENGNCHIQGFCSYDPMGDTRCR